MRTLIDDLLLYSHVSQRPYETGAIDYEQIKRVLEDLELDVAEKKGGYSSKQITHSAGLPTTVAATFSKPHLQFAKV